MEHPTKSREDLNEIQHDWCEKLIEQYNSDKGKKHLYDGINCPYCNNKGLIMTNRNDYPVAVPCECYQLRVDIRKNGSRIVKERDNDED